MVNPKVCPFALLVAAPCSIVRDFSCSDRLLSSSGSLLLTEDEDWLIARAAALMGTFTCGFGPAIFGVNAQPVDHSYQRISVEERQDCRFIV